MSFKISVDQLLHAAVAEPPTPRRVEAEGICPTCKILPKSIADSGIVQPYCRRCAAEHTRVNRARAIARRKENRNAATVTIT
jgi:hypothetical protein